MNYKIYLNVIVSVIMTYIIVTVLIEYFRDKLLNLRFFSLVMTLIKTS